MAIPDLLERQKGILTLREVKSRQNKVFPSDIAQLKATLLCVMENHKAQKYRIIVETAQRKETYSAIYYRQDADTIFSEISAAHIIVGDIKKGIKPNKPQYSGKCTKCSRRNLCWKNKYEGLF